MNGWRPYEPCLENEVRTSFWKFIIHIWGFVNFDVPPPPQSAKQLADWYEARKSYRQ